jgi:Holliday junction DNA helicase RuvA
MIGSLRGRILEVHPAFAILEVQGIGYVIKSSIPFLASLMAGEERFVYIHDHIREDAHDLFGFGSIDELAFFERLISISGVGPKVALTILSSGTIDSVKRAVMAGDLDALTSVPGVGKKTAQKIVLELKGQLVEEEGETSGDREAVEALVSLGYSASQARGAMKHVAPTIMDTSARIREALRFISA